jgi:hypothetical protein
MNSFAEILTLEEKWIDALFQFRIYFPSEDPRNTNLDQLRKNSIDAIRVPQTPEEITMAITPPDYKNIKNFYTSYATSLNFTEHLILSLACFHKFLPGNLDRKIHHYFFSNLKEPASIVRNVVGININGSAEKFVPTLNFLAYILCGNNIGRRIELFREIHLQKIPVLNGEDILLGDRDLEDPLFCNAFLLSDELALKFLE